MELSARGFSNMEEIIAQIKAVQTTPQSVRVEAVKDKLALKKGIKDGIFGYYEGLNGYYVTIKNE
jgi:hypothetical protein